LVGEISHEETSFIRHTRTRWVLRNRVGSCCPRSSSESRFWVIRPSVVLTPTPLFFAPTPKR
jgi:hypothetical protein